MCVPARAIGTKGEVRIEIVEILGVDKKNDLVYKIMQEYKNNDGYESKSIGTYINIYELSHKCKEWAKKNLFAYMNIGTISETRANLDLRVKYNFGIWRGYSCIVVTLDERHSCLYTAKYYETENEAIFDACQWILDNKEF